MKHWSEKITVKYLTFPIQMSTEHIWNRLSFTVEDSMEVSQKTKNRTTIWPRNSTAGYISKKNPKTLLQKDACTPMFIAALFTIAKIRKQPKCPLTDKWIKNMWCVYIYIYIYIYIYKGILLIHKEEWNFAIAATWMNLEGIMLSEISQAKKDKNCMISFICGT